MLFSARTVFGFRISFDACLASEAWPLKAIRLAVATIVVPALFRLREMLIPGFFKDSLTDPLKAKP